METRKEVLRISVRTIDGTLFSLPIYEGEKIENKVREFHFNYCEAVKENPKPFGIQVWNNTCPFCNSKHVFYKNGRVWCPECNKVLLSTQDDMDN